VATHHQQSTARQRVAIVVDGGTVPGREVVRRLSADGAAVVVHYTEDQAAADALVDEILAGGGNAVTVRADVGDELDVERLLTETVRTLGGVDVLVNAPVEPTFGRLVVEATPATRAQRHDRLRRRRGPGFRPGNATGVTRRLSVRSWPGLRPRA